MVMMIAIELKTVYCCYWWWYLLVFTCLFMTQSPIIEKEAYKYHNRVITYKLNDKWNGYGWSDRLMWWIECTKLFAIDTAYWSNQHTSTTKQNKIKQHQYWQISCVSSPLHYSSRSFYDYARVLYYASIEVLQKVIRQVLMMVCCY